jgi:hypothetical protein
MDPFILRANPRPGRCAVHGCRSRVASGTSNGRLCRRCREHRYKALHPYTYHLNKLRNNARRRGIAFDLTLEEFTMFCDLTGYMAAHGRFADDLSIDRIRDSEGYVLDNIRAITVSENRRKQAITQKLDRLARIREAVARAYLKAA